MENAVQENAVTTRGIGTKYGLYAAGFGIFFFFVLVFTGQNVFDNKWGFVNLPVSILILVLAHREFKQSGNGFMSYGQGVAIGFWMTLVSLVIGFLIQWAYISFVEPEVMERFYELQRIQLEDSGMPDSQIDTVQSGTRRFFWVFGFFAALFFGVLLAVIVSIFTQKKNPQPAF
ncbi:MAG TPA: DUF4199 domain-containing protein [Cyclobacteriaceae bacterium]|nr:DUF4199 domain-containing protein [Cyclobacteriaceae bacterium]